MADAPDATPRPVWQMRVEMEMPLLIEYAQQITYRFPQIPGPIHNHHTDNDLAKAAGFSRPVAEPAHYLAFFDNALLGLYGTSWLEGGELQVNILAPVFAGEVVELSIGPAERTPHDPRRVCHRLTVLGPSGDLVTVGSACATVPGDDDTDLPRC